MIMKLKFLTGFFDWRVIELRMIISFIKPINNDFACVLILKYRLISIFARL